MVQHGCLHRIPGKPGTPQVFSPILNCNVLSIYVCSDQTTPIQCTPATYTVARIIDINKFSQFSKLLAVTAYVLCFFSNTKRTDSNPAMHLSHPELLIASVKWIHAVQHEHFSAEIQNLQSQSQWLSLVQQLRLFLNKDKLLRCGGQMHNAELAKFPYLLPSRYHFTDLVILQAHTATPQWC